ncbi:MAG: hypothetical protein AB2815_01470 [Candidatus Sedimenticola endophacoides]
MSIDQQKLERLVDKMPTFPQSVHRIIETRVSLPRERFWDIPVPKIDSPTRQPLLPRPSCAHHDSVPHIAAKLLVR